MLAALVAALSTTTIAHAATVVDVNNLVTGTASGGWYAGSSNSFGVISRRLIAQTWTVQSSGKLAQIDLFGSGVTSAYINFYSGGSLATRGTNLIGTLAVSVNNQTAAIESFDVSGLGIQVSAGDILTFELQAADPAQSGMANSWYNWTSLLGGSNSGQYSGGSLYDSFNGKVGTDLNFRTFVNVNGAVPESATWLMMMLGFGGMGFAMRRKNKVATRIRIA